MVYQVQNRRIRGWSWQRCGGQKFQSQGLLWSSNKSERSTSMTFLLCICGTHLLRGTEMYYYSSSMLLPYDTLLAWELFIASLVEATACTRELLPSLPVAREHWLSSFFFFFLFDFVILSFFSDLSKYHFLLFRPILLLIVYIVLFCFTTHP